jgi:hypothetical protein
MALLADMAENGGEPDLASSESEVPERKLDGAEGPAILDSPPYCDCIGKLCGGSRIREAIGKLCGGSRIREAIGILERISTSSRVRNQRFLPKI